MARTVMERFTERIQLRIRIRIVHPSYEMGCSEKAWPERRKFGSGMFLVPTLAITESETDSRSHKSDWRNQEHENSTTDRALPIFRGPRGIAVTHGTPLREGWSSPEREKKGSAGYL
jgi:hypothetical protein